MSLDKVTIWMRLEPRSRRPDRVNHHLQAPILDPLWMLARQWQTGELAGEDGGAPAWVEVKHRVAPLTPADASGLGDDAGEAVGEHVLFGETPALSWGDRARLGQELCVVLAGVLGDAQLDITLDDLSTRYPLESAPDEAILPGERRASALADGSVIDGAKVALAAKGITLAASEPTLTVIKAAIQDWAGGVQRRYPSLGAEVVKPSTWSTDEQRYRAKVKFQAGDGVSHTLNVASPSAAGLGWSSLDQHGQEPITLTTDLETSGRVLPGRVHFPGMPAPRWWDFEDSARSLLSIQVAKHDLARVMWLEFLLVGCDDWFVAPLRAPRGSVVQIDHVVVCDVFGVETTLSAADANDLEKNAAAGTQRWSLFRPTCEPRSSAGGGLAQTAFTQLPKLANLLVIPPGFGPLAQKGPRLEELRLLRDEDANLVWGVSHTVEDRWGRPVRGSDVSAHRPGKGDDAPLPTHGDSSSSGPLRYRARTPVPGDWTPFVAQRQRKNDQIVLRRAVLWSEQGTARPVHGRLLNEIGDHGELSEETVPRAGVHIARELWRARTASGETVTWVQRSRSSGPGEGASGLRFDLALPDPNLTTK